MSQGRDSIRTVPLQAGPGTSGDMDQRAAQTIGRKLAQIGDELNRHYLNKPPNPWLHPLFRAAHAHQLVRNRIHRRLLSAQLTLRGRPEHGRQVWAWLTSHLHRHWVRAECWGSWVSLGRANPSSWAVGMLSAVLLASAVAWIFS